MAYARGYQHDVFISYAHTDNLAGEGEPGWVEGFEKDLRRRLVQRLGEQTAAVWRDGRLRGNDAFDETIAEAVAGAAVFVALTSTGYLKSDYCLRELDGFVEGARGGVVVAGRKRVFNVLLHRIPFERWPGAHQRGGEASGFPLYEAAEGDALGEPAAPRSPRYEEGLKKLASAIAETLDALNAQAAAAAPAGGSPSGAPSTRRVVFVGDAVDSLREERKRLVAELGDRFEVRGGVPPPYEADAHDARVRAELEASALALYLLDDVAGRPIREGSAVTFSWRQVDLAREAGTPALIWAPHGLRVRPDVEAEYGAFLDGLLGPAEDGVRPYELLVRVPRDEVLRRAADLVPAPAAERERAAALFVAHTKDGAHAFTAAESVQRVDGSFQALFSRIPDEPQQALDGFAEQVRRVSAVVVFCGEVAAEWARDRLEAAAKIAFGEGHRLSFAVYLAPPRRPEPGLRFHPMLHAEVVTDPDGLCDFLGLRRPA